MFCKKKAVLFTSPIILLINDNVFQTRYQVLFTCAKQSSLCQNFAKYQDIMDNVVTKGSEILTVVPHEKIKQ